MIFILLVALVFLGVPFAFAILGSLTVLMSAGDLPYHIRIVSQQFFGGMESFPLLAIPLFILAGELMNEAGITHRIINLASAIVGRLKAGLAHVNIWASVIFAGLSGSAIADTSALGRVFIPSMEKEGYPRDFAAALTAASSVIGPIIPPSIPVIIYALTVSGVSVPGLFLAGIVPGFLLALGLSIYVYFFAGDLSTAKVKQQSRRHALLHGLLPALMPVFVVGAILAGIVTPTEAAAFAVVYALILGVVLYRNIKLVNLPGIFARAMRDSAVIMVIMGAVAAANWVLTFERVPNMLTEWALMSIDTQWTFLIAVILLLLVVGLFLEGIAAILVLVPILHPIAMALGIDPLHFGIVVIFNLMMGLITPPMGLCLFVADSVSGVGMGPIIRRIMPMLAVQFLVLLLITFVPSLVTFLPRLAGY
ncbi:MAG: C4-dicarboxylate ABC transporter permease [Halomonas sp.]|jgi:tripartite ATP-independent transporter DctM subunit|uniref:TRAP transporter large permease n=1 Tax=Halomonas sp. Ps84H-12 TaxID=2954501 RepID=UPI000C5D9886|nr:MULTISPECIES: TRAP transporter large permease [unclassified Halomonas]MAP35424.1 C4-dicarboxylate ABC transporter permease [Halomonas sp.]MAP35748.1 C4-dicarboxylate ABC transporter permease [Halomonas sp.]MCO7242514.1 TRAP transporter large permease [Halomonas sp. Ps84H-12]HAV46558.1 C4-dicarboxylate ABC transporter permease [Halomonas sp.]|tara:strand:- start:567 stop:1832 length:1266 start_codon:yes stop_codon:yes gene_type:complete